MTTCNISHHESFPVVAMSCSYIFCVALLWLLPSKGLNELGDSMKFGMSGV